MKNAGSLTARRQVCYYGGDGMAKQKVFTPPVVAAVLGDLKLGYTAKQAGLRHGVAVRTVLRWASLARIEPNGSVLPIAAKESIGALVDDYLRKSLKALGAQADFAAGSEYLKEQSADNLAALHNALAAQAIRVLSALRDDIPVLPAPESDVR